MRRLAELRDVKLGKILGRNFNRWRFRLRQGYGGQGFMSKRSKTFEND
jgi:hypothetical protein